MNEKNIQSILQDALEEKIPSSQIELWSAVKTELVAGKHPLIQQGEKMNTSKPRRILRAAFVTLTIVVLLALAFITPQGQAFAKSILQFFIRSESDFVPVPTEEEEPVTWVDLTPDIPPPTATPLPPMAIFTNECGDFPNPTCTVEQIRSKVDFTVKEPSNIPEGLYFVGATGGPDSVYLSYSSQDQGSGIMMFVERWTGILSPDTDLVGANATVEKVKIGGLAGEYFKGSFVYEDGQSVATWDPNFGIETLRWVDGDVSYRMQHVSFQTLLGKVGMAALAESMTLESVVKLPMPTPDAIAESWDPREYWNLNVSEAEQQAGFKLILPATMPEVLPLFAANYDAEVSIVGVYYRLERPGFLTMSEGLVLRQQIAPNPSECSICDIFVGDSNAPTELDLLQMIVPPDSNLETVQIGAVTGKYFEGSWHHPDGCCYAWDPAPYFKTLRWWKDGRAFELQYLGMDIEKADMIRIAESLK